MQLAGDFSALPPVKWGGKALKAGGEFFGKEEPVSLSASKDKLVHALRELGQTIIVTIDDVDRLEPREAFEVLRLVRSVADFPNVIYLLCYDSKVLAESVQHTAGVQDGRHFLEKIVQLTVIVPTPEPFQLRSWFTDELKQVGVPRTAKGLERLKEVINWDGGRRLRSPRSVVRALDSIKFMWPALEQEGADFSDLVWLQIIKNDNLALYRWIENYLSSQSVIALQIGQVDKADRESDANALAEADTDGFFRSLSYRHHFSDQLPGLDADYNDDAVVPKIYEAVQKQDQDKAIAEKRLASPDHYRIYFSFAAPSHTIGQAELTRFWEALDANLGLANETFLQLYDRVVLGSFSKADVLLERLDVAEAEGLSPLRCRNLLLLFADVLDDAYRARAFDRFWVDTIWDRAQRLLPRLLAAVGDDRAGIVAEMFASGRAIEWLTQLLRRETFAHGRYGDRPKIEKERILTDAELDTAIEKMLARYHQLTFEQVLGLVDPLNLLFAWNQAGDEDGPRDLVAQNIGSDESFIALVESMRGEVNSSIGRYNVLKKESISPFLDYDQTRTRVYGLVADDGPLQARAKALERDFEQAERF